MKRLFPEPIWMALCLVILLFSVKRNKDNADEIILLRTKIVQKEKEIKILNDSLRRWDEHSYRVAKQTKILLKLK